MDPMLELLIYRTFPSDVNYMHILAGPTPEPSCHKQLKPSRRPGHARKFKLYSPAPKKVGIGNSASIGLVPLTRICHPSSPLVKNIGFGLLLIHKLANQIAIGEQHMPPHASLHMSPPNRAIAATLWHHPLVGSL
eukprot:scaffold13863_cov59-Attheya_sp.AAC.3